MRERARKICLQGGHLDRLKEGTFGFWFLRKKKHFSPVKAKTSLRMKAPKKLKKT